MKNKIHAVINTIIFIIMCIAASTETVTWVEVIVLYACALYLVLFALINMDYLKQARKGGLSRWIKKNG